MRIPDKIEFMNQIWQIESVRSQSLDGDLGLCDPRTNIIKLDQDLNEDVLLQTLTHEWIHLIEITLHQCLTEQQVDVLATGFIHIMKNNPELNDLYRG